MPDTMDECTERHSKREFVVSEKKSKVVFRNPRQREVEQIQVDDCAITSGKRCDCLINVPQDDLSIFVELKGSEVEHALEQLERSHRVLRAHTRNEIVWIVSSSRCPLTSTEVQNRALKLRRSRGIRLIIKNSPVEYPI